MAATRNCLVFDLGAESGRAVLGRYDGSLLALEDVHRFPNGPVRLRDSIYWDTLRLFSEIKQGISSAIRDHACTPDSIGLDTWGVDFGLLDHRGELIGNPFHYRDRRCDGMLEAAFSRVPRAEIFERTGIQFMQINTLYQLLSMTLQGSPALSSARTMLLMPDLFSYWLTGTIRSERTIASTSQCLDPNSGAWALPLLERLGIPTHIFSEIVEPGTVLGPLLPSVAEETGAVSVQVIAGGSHDTASAVAAVPAETDDYAYLSSGTWSLMGVELPRPVINEKALAYNFTNEGGVCNTIRLLKNITGLWLIQECRRTWAAEGAALSYEEIAHMAAEAPPSTAFVDPDHRDFMAPGRHAFTHTRLLQADGSAASRNRRITRTAGIRKPRSEVPLDARKARGAHRQAPRNYPHRRRRVAEPASQPVHRRRDGTCGGCRPRGGDCCRQCSDAADRLGRARRHRGRAGGHPHVFQNRGIRAPRYATLGGRLPEIPRTDPASRCISVRNRASGYVPGRDRNRKQSTLVSRIGLVGCLPQFIPSGNYRTR